MRRGETIRNSLGDKPNGLILAHPEMLCGVLDELHACGLAVGKDVKLVCWGTPEFKRSVLKNTRWEKSTLDMIEWSRAEMGEMAIRILAARMRDPYLPVMRAKISTTLRKNV